MTSDTDPGSGFNSATSLVKPLSKLLLDELQGQLLLLDPPQGLVEQLLILQRQNGVQGETVDITEVVSSELASRRLDDRQNPLFVEQIPETLAQLEGVDTVFLGDLATTAEIFAPVKRVDPRDPHNPGGAGQSGTDNIAAITRLLSYCRDRVRNRVFIRLKTGPDSYQIPGELLLSLGYIKLPTITQRQSQGHESASAEIEAGNMQAPEQMYFFSLQSYKTQPDWLNSRFWANPERWNLPN